MSIQRYVVRKSFLEDNEEKIWLQPPQLQLSISHELESRLWFALRSFYFGFWLRTAAKIPKSL